MQKKQIKKKSGEESQKYLHGLIQHFQLAQTVFSP